MNKFVTLAAVASIAGLASASVVWDEAVDGNLSNDPLAPTDLGAFSVGDNIVRGSTLGSATAPSDGYDVFQFEILAGQTLDAVILSGYTPSTGGTSGFNFSTGAAAGAPGATILFGPGWGGANVGQDLFDAALGGPIDSLGAGVYFMEVREFGGPQADWELTFVVVPAPGAAALAGLAGLAAVRRRR